MQLKTVGESLGALNSINEIINRLNNNFITYKGAIVGLTEISKNYSIEAIKAAIAQSTLTETQIRAILSAKGLTGQALEIAVAETMQAQATNALAASEGAAIPPTLSFKNAIKGLGDTLKSFALSHPIITAIAAIGTTILGVAKTVDYFTVNLEEQQELTKELQDDLSEIQSDIKDVNSELETYGDRIDELNAKEHRSFVEQAELETLIATNDELERQNRLLAEKEAQKKQEVAKSVEEEFKKEYGNAAYTLIVSDSEISDIKNKRNRYYELWDRQWAGELNVDEYEEMLRLQKEINSFDNRDMTTDFEGYINSKIDAYNALYEKQKSGIELTEEQANRMERYRSELIDYATDLDDYVDRYGIDDETSQAWHNLSVAITDCLYPAEALTKKFDEVFSGLSNNIKNELIVLAQNGTLSVDDLSSEIIDIFEAAGFKAEEIVEQLLSTVERLSDTRIVPTINFDLESFQESISAIQSGYEVLLSAQEEYNEYGAITASTLKELMDDNLIQYLQYAADGLSINTSALENNEQALKAAATAELYNAMCNDILNLSLEDTSKLSSIAQTAIANLDSAAATAGENASIAAKGWWEYGASIESIPGVSDLTGDNYTKAEAIVGQYKNLANSINSISIGKTNSANKSSSGSNLSSLKDAFTQEYNTLKHNLEINYITEKEYYDSLAALNEKYFAGKEEYLDEYRQYEQEVYKGLQSYYKNYIDSQLNLLESQLDAGIINYAHYSSTVRSLLDTMYADNKISAEDYHNYIKQMLEKQLDIYDRALSAVTRRFDTEIDKINETIDGIEKQNEALENQLDNYDSILSVIDSVYEAEIDRIQAEQDAIQGSIDALQDENDERELALKLEEARWALYKAQTQRTKKVFNGTEFVYGTDQDAIREAQENLADLELEQVVDGLEKEKDALDDTISELEKYRDLWAEISDAYETETDEQLIIALYGRNYQEIILRSQLSDIKSFKNNYVSIQDQINNNEGLIASYEEKIQYYELLKQQWSDIADAYEDSMEDQYAAMILGQDWEADVLNGRLDTLNHFKDQYIAIQQAMANAAIAANEAIAASNEADKPSQMPSSIPITSSDNTEKPSSDSHASNSSAPTSSVIVRDADTGAVYFSGSDAQCQAYISSHNLSIIRHTTYLYEVRSNTATAIGKSASDKNIKNTVPSASKSANRNITQKITAKYASGTDYARKGLSLVSENEHGDEIIIKNDGSAVVAQGEQLYPFEGGETVITASKTKKILSNMENAAPSDNSTVLSKIMSKLPPFNEEEFRKRVMSTMPSYSSMVQIPNMQTPNYNFQPANRDNSVKVEIGDIHLHDVQRVDTLANEIIRELPNKVIQRLGRK